MLAHFPVFLYLTRLFDLDEILHVQISARSSACDKFLILYQGFFDMVCEILLFALVTSQIAPGWERPHITVLFFIFALEISQAALAVQPNFQPKAPRGIVDINF